MSTNSGTAAFTSPNAWKSKLSAANACDPFAFFLAASITGNIATAGIPKSKISRHSRTRSFTLLRSTPGIEATGTFSAPPCTKTG